MFKNLKKVVQNIQTADETKKKRWLFVLSALAMIIVISSWVVYLNKTIVNLGPAESEKNNQPLVKIPKESPWQVFLTGLKIITSQIKELVATTREISIESGAVDFATSSEKISPKLLP
ncbi:MAG: hypothetical protein AAB404_01115 [Patescibacteria group bacterium]